MLESVLDLINGSLALWLSFIGAVYEKLHNTSDINLAGCVTHKFLFNLVRQQLGVATKADAKVSFQRYFYHDEVMDLVLDEIWYDQHEPSTRVASSSI